MTPRRATLCLALALTGCVGVPSDPTPAAAALSREELCSAADDLLGRDVAVLGPFDSDVVTPNGGTVVHCEPGTCCNLTYYAPSIGCGENERRIAVTFDVAMLEDVTAPDRLDFVCRTSSDDLRPSEACPVDARCAEELGRVTSLRGRLERRASPLVGTEQLTLVVTASSSLAPGGL